MKISVIIPVYNVEEYLKECIDSALAQTMPKDDYEIILVNDGSKDKSDEICAEYKKAYNNICVINQQNGGPSKATNNALKIARGKYIYIFHSDDIMNKELLDTCYRTAEENNLDALHFGYKVFYDKKDKDKISYYKKDGEEVLTKNVPCNEVMTGKQFFINEIWGGPAFCFLFNRKFIIENDLFFDENLQVEDFDFMPRMFMRSKRIMQINKILYNYRIRFGSISGNPNRYIPSYKKWMNNFFVLVQKEMKEKELIDPLKKYFLVEYVSLIQFVFYNSKDINKDIAEILNEYMTKYFKVFGMDLSYQELIIFKKILVLIKYPNADIRNKIEKKLIDLFDSIDKRIEKIKRNLLMRIPFNDAKKNIVIYGIGSHTEEMLNFYEKNIGCICSRIVFMDSNRGYENETFRGCKVINVKNINAEKVDCVVISSASYEEELYEILCNYLTKDIDVFMFYNNINKQCRINLFEK